MQQKQSFEDMVTLRPEFGPLNADEEPTEEEMYQFNRAYTKVLEFIHGPKSDSVIGVMKNAPELYKGIGQAAFQILLSVKQQMEKDGKPVEPAAFWGEGGAIQSTVDELFQLARAAGIPTSEEKDQYSGAMFEVYRLAGEYIQNANEDGAINQAQELLVDVESAGGRTGNPYSVMTPDREEALNSTRQNSMAARQAMQDQAGQAATPQEQQLPAQGQGEAPMPPQMNGILGG